MLLQDVQETVVKIALWHNCHHSGISHAKSSVPSPVYPRGFSPLLSLGCRSQMALGQTDSC